MNRIGIDLGGPKIEGILSTDNPMDVLVRKRVSTEQEKGYAQVLANIAGLIEELRNASDEPVKLGMGIPGVVNQSTKRVQQANAQCLIGEALEEDLANRLGQGINIENDAIVLSSVKPFMGQVRAINALPASSWEPVWVGGL